MIDAYIISCLLILFRVSAFVAFLPPVNGQGLPNTVKIGLAISLVFVLAPLHAPRTALELAMSPVGDGAWMRLAWLGVRETALGAGLAWLFSLCLVPVRVGGAWIAQEMGLTMAGMASPMDQQPGNVVSQVLESVGIVAFFLLDLHHVLFGTLARSFHLRSCGAGWSMPSWETVIWSVSQSVDQGLLIIAPVGILLFVASLTVLITMRTAPQFNFMSYGMTLRILAGLGGLLIYFPELCAAIQHLLFFVGREAV